MSDKDNFDIDDELARSLERLVEEETNVAKAAYSEDKIKAEDIKKEPENINLGATQMVDKDKVKSLTSAIKLNDEQDIKTVEDTSDFTIYVPYVGNALKNTTSIKSVKIEDDENDWDEDENLDESKTVQKINKMNSDNPVTMSNQTSPEDGKNKKELDKKSKLIIAGACGIAALVVIIIIVIAVNMNSKNKKSYKYNLEKGTQYYNTQDYDNAVTYLTKAYNTNDGKKNADMMYELADALVHVKQNDKAIEVLKSALSYDKMNEKALPLLAKLYQDEKKGTELSELIKKYKGTKNEALLSDYKVDEPTSSENPGSFEDSVEINLMASDGCTIYYTTDGSEPTTKSSKYSSTIKIEKDDVTVKAIAVNSIGVASDVAEFKYSISLKAPDAPVLNPSE